MVKGYIAMGLDQGKLMDSVLDGRKRQQKKKRSDSIGIDSCSTPDFGSGESHKGQCDSHHSSGHSDSGGHHSCGGHDGGGGHGCGHGCGGH